MRALVRPTLCFAFAVALLGCSSSEPVATNRSVAAPAVARKTVEVSPGETAADSEKPQAEREETLGFDPPIGTLEEEVLASEPEAAPEPPKPFVPEDGSFQATFPASPEATTEVLQDGGSLATYRVATGGIERLVNAYDLTESMDRETAEATLQTIVASIVEAAGGEATVQELVADETLPTMRFDYVYEADGERFRTAGIMTIVGQRQFQASVLATEAAWDAIAAQEFLASFRPTVEAPLTAARSADAGTPDRMPVADVATTEAPVENAGVEKKLPWTDATIRFPVEPEVVSDDALSETDRVYHAFDEALSFSVTLHREEEPMPLEVAGEALAATAEAIAGSVDGTVIASDPSSNERFAEHRLAYEYAGEDGAKVLVRQRLIYLGATQIYLIVAGPAANFDEAAAETFFDSWQLSDSVAEGAEEEVR